MSMCDSMVSPGCYVEGRGTRVLHRQEPRCAVVRGSHDTGPQVRQSGLRPTTCREERMRASAVIESGTRPTSRPATCYTGRRPHRLAAKDASLLGLETEIRILLGAPDFAHVGPSISVGGSPIRRGSCTCHGSATSWCAGRSLGLSRAPQVSRHPLRAIIIKYRYAYGMVVLDSSVQGEERHGGIQHGA
jgi:hypothetical protein